ncbi:hypothetical protein Q8F55_004901 [Vanrija albida]|uniref:Ricin B lectin domain-containing protein n=1 Tax=Vanrija albida TaxID=181172 RepID=A0ABR3Q040_9TREE
MRLATLLTVPLLASAALANPVAELARRYVTKEGIFRVSWTSADLGPGNLGTPAQFACCGPMNYSEVTSGTPVNFGQGPGAPKFFFLANSEWAGKPSLIGLRGPREAHCLDVGDYLCFDVPDGNRTNGLQVWTCYRGNTNQLFSFPYLGKQ